ncbi:MAG: hypothetical protein CM15mP74_15120 [Halieaceae bacterium]|nr:MAG: hypothetical protein CM15mP74_15120 [Halieaceae bacterium]
MPIRAFRGRAALDVEGNELAVRGQMTPDGEAFQYEILIDGNSAGIVELYLTSASSVRVARP